jgi:hypothetical protein
MSDDCLAQVARCDELREAISNTVERVVTRSLWCGAKFVETFAQSGQAVRSAVAGKGRWRTGNKDLGRWRFA